MKRTMLLVMILLSGVCLFANQSSRGLRRFAMFIGTNDGGHERVRLRYAESDARRVEFLLYYSGHSDERGLLLGEERVAYRDLKDSIEEIQADVNIAILDSCFSGAFTRLKGGTRQLPFMIDESIQMKGHAFLTSSSADEAAQESDHIGGSYFTHYMIAGLRGAADSTRDEQISLNEVYHYAFSETLARTETSRAGAQHPSYNIQLTGTGDLTMTDLRVASSTIVLSEQIDGRLYIRGPRGNLVVEVRKDIGGILVLALPEGRSSATNIVLRSGVRRGILHRYQGIRCADWDCQHFRGCRWHPDRYCQHLQRSSPGCPGRNRKYLEGSVRDSERTGQCG